MHKVKNDVTAFKENPINGQSTISWYLAGLVLNRKCLFLDSGLGIPEESFHARLQNHHFVLNAPNIEMTIDNVTIIY